LPKSWSDGLGEQIDADLDDEAAQVEEEFGAAPDGDGAGPEQDGQDGGEAEERAGADDVRDGGERPGELELWNAEASRAIAGIIRRLDTMIEWLGSDVNGLVATLPAKITFSVTGGKIAVESAVGRAGYAQKDGDELKLSITPHTPAALRRALFHRHTTEQLTMLDGGVSEATMAEIEAGRAEATEREVDGAALVGAFGPEESADAESEPAEAVA